MMMTKNKLRLFVVLVVVLFSVSVLFAGVENEKVNEQANSKETEQVNNVEISYAWFSMECLLENEIEETVANAQVQIYCVNLENWERELFFEGVSDSEGRVHLATVRDVYQVPEQFFFTLNVKTEDLYLSRNFSGTLDYDGMFEKLQTIIIPESENASLFESEWVAYKLEEDEVDKHVISVAGPKCYGRCIFLYIDSIPINAEIYVNEVYLGNTPLEYSIPIESIFLDNDVYVFRIHKNGYEDEYFEVDINS